MNRIKFFMKTSLVLACSPNVIVTMFQSCFFFNGCYTFNGGWYKMHQLYQCKGMFCILSSLAWYTPCPVPGFSTIHTTIHPRLITSQNLLFLHSLFFFFLILYNDILFNAIILIYAISLLNLVMKIMHLENKRPFVVIV